MAYWIGQDGNVWVSQADGSAVNYGRPVGQPMDQGVDAQMASIGTNRIADPNPIPTNTSTATTTALSGGGGGDSNPFNQGAADNTQKAIDLLPGILRAALGAEGTSYGNVKSGFGAQETAQRGTYGKSSETNQLNYDSNFMDAIRAGIHGLGGLMALLRGTGASGGTADQNVRDMVGGTTSNDIRTGADTRNTNQTALDSSLSSFLSDLKLKRQAAKDTFANNKASIRHDSNTNLQDLYQKMAGYYSDSGNTAAANSWLAKAGDLTTDIARDSVKRVSPYDTNPVVVHAPNLTAFQAPTEPSVITSPNGQVGSGIFTIGNKRNKDQQTQTLQTAAAGA